jgi:Ca2+-transporting ATPase
MSPDTRTGLETIHVLPLRIRFRIASLKRQPGRESQLNEALRRRSGIQRVKASSTTGTLLVEYDSSLTPEAVVTMVADSLRRPVPDVIDGGGVTAKPVQKTTVRDWIMRLFEGSRAPTPALHDQQLIERPWHTLTTFEIHEILGTTPNGLAQADVERNLRQYGPNLLPAPRGQSLLRLFVHQLASIPVLILLASSALSLFTGGVVDAVVILAVVLLNALIGTSTEKHAERTIASLTKLTEPGALVAREGRVVRIDATQLTVGDRLLLSRGSYVPADARLLEARNLSVSESALTGESAPVFKQVAALEPDLPIADRGNMVYRGTVITGGSGIAVVVAVGMQTEIGKIHALMNEASRRQTPIEIQLDTLGRQAGFAALMVCVAMILFGWLRRLPFVETLRSAVSLAVSALPEGLPTMATTALAYGMLRLRKQNVIARELAAVETVGAVDILCLDKTGTLTMDRMVVTDLIAGAEYIPIPTARDMLLHNDRHDLRMLVSACALCNEAEVADGELTGSSTETALLKMVEQVGLETKALRKRSPLLHTEARAEGRNYMITYHAMGDGKLFAALKGSPEEVLGICIRQENRSSITDLTAQDRAQILEWNRLLASQGRRILGVAYLESDYTSRLPSQGFTWAGLVALSDPLRPGVTETIQSLATAGIQTRMLTGDQQFTARALAEQLGLIDRASDVLDTTTLSGDGIPEEDIDRAVVFARVSPAKKLEIIRTLQGRGHIVSMTGDGINDGPALRAADSGVALGRQGTETARDAADLILPDDNIQSLVNAVREGRAVHENIRRAVRFLVATNLSEVLSVMGAIGVGLAQPLTPRQLLWLNLVTDVFPVLALAIEPPHPGIMHRPATPPGEPLIAQKEYLQLGTQSLLISGAVAGSYMYALRRYGAGAKATTMAFVSLTSAQLLHTFFSRYEDDARTDRQLPTNRSILYAVLGGLALEFITLFPPLRSLLGLASLTVADLGVALASVAASYAGNLLLQALFRRLRKPQLQLPSPKPARNLHLSTVTA